MEDERVVLKITVADLQEKIGGRLGRKLTDEEILYLEPKMLDCVSWREAYHILLFKDFKIDENSDFFKRIKKMKNNEKQ